MRHVLIFEQQNDTAVMKVLDQLHFSAERIETSFSPAVQARMPIAVIVSDAVEAPLDLCKALSSHHPVILLSDDKSFAFRHAAALSGISALIQRPIDPIELSEWLEQFVTRAVDEAISVLIVDDDWLTSELNAEILRCSGMTVTTVADPTQALQAIEDTLPDLVLMDVQMPGVDGVQLAQVIRQSRQFISLPIIFLSAEQDEDRQMTARRLGGDDFVSKPIHPEKLISLVRLRADRSKSLRSMIERDRLTGLFNHSRFEERLSQELERCRRTGAEVSLVTIDVDRFKQVNDTFGHPMGDAVLRSLSGALTTGLRHIDVVGRCGGEEFGVILLDTGPQPGKIVIDRLRLSFGSLTFGGGTRQLSVSFSAGIASSRNYASLADLVAAADKALYEAKDHGRDCVRVADPSDRRDSDSVYQIEAGSAGNFNKRALR